MEQEHFKNKKLGCAPRHAPASGTWETTAKWRL